MLTQDKINKEDWKEKFFERFGGEGTIAKTDENCILIAFTKKEVIDFIETLLKEQREGLISKLEEYKMYYNPIGDEINKGRRLACDDFINLIKEDDKNQ